jgi:hypothetical protein
VVVDGRGVAELIGKIGPHRLPHLRQERSGGVVIEINAPHAHILRPARWAAGDPSPSPIFLQHILQQGLGQFAYGKIFMTKELEAK